MTEFVRADLTGARFDDVGLANAAFHDVDLTNAHFDDVGLTGATFHDVDLTNTHFEEVDLTGVTIRGGALVHVEISGHVDDLVINGVDVAPLVEAELDRRYPQRSAMRPKDAVGLREAWDILGVLWAQTITRAQALPAQSLHERVDGGWSFIETLRHLLFATDAWVSRAVLGVPVPWDALDLPHDEMPDTPTVPRDRDVRPSLAEVLALRAQRRATVGALLATLTDEQLAGQTEPVLSPGYPEPESFAVLRCLRTVVSEEWEHRLYAERDLTALEAAAASGGS